jgi:formylglycine-generating enzyme required for sulfatase activity
MKFVAMSCALVLLSPPLLPAGSPKEITNALGIKLIRIEPGEFTMGNGAEPPRDRESWQTRDWDEAPAHKVKITRAFYLGAFEITNAQFEVFDPTHRQMRGKFASSRADNEPVTHVTWQQAVDFCAWLSKKEGKPYRLPTEAEWEYACRAGSTDTFSTGDTLGPDQANIGLSNDAKQKLDTTAAVGSYPPNAWGLRDMHGNVLEWCLDWYGPYEGGMQLDPVGRAEGYARVARGGSFLAPSKTKDNAHFCRSTNRSGFLPEDANRHTGFRVVQGDMPASKPLPEFVPLNQRDVKQTPARGAGPKSPYFMDFTVGGKNPTIAKDAWGPIFAQHNHFSAVCVCPNGDVLGCWYSTVRESGREMVQAASRLRAGSDRWEPASLFFSVPDVNCHAPVLLCDGKRIYHFANQAQTGWDNAAIILRTSDDSGATWSHPRIILSRDHPEHQSQPCTALVAKDGALVVAIDGDLHRDERLLISRDGGQTWKLTKGDMRKTLGGKYVIHPAVAQRTDGAVLCFLRGPHPMPLVISKDMGDTWDVKSTPFPGIGGGQKSVALRLASGALLFCSIDTRKELVGGGTFAALSFDDGASWAHVRKVEGVGGYMSVAQAPNGVIYLFGTRMGCAAFNEAWLRAGQGLKK